MTINYHLLVYCQAEVIKKRYETAFQVVYVSNGNATENTVPSPIFDSTSIVPPYNCTNRLTTPKGVTH